MERVGVCLPPVGMPNPNVFTKLEPMRFGLEILDELGRNLDLSGCLNLLYAVRLCGFTDSQAIVCKDSVSSFKRRLDVVILRAFTAEGPVRVVKVNPRGSTPLAFMSLVCR